MGSRKPEVGSWEFGVVGWSCQADTSTSLSVTVDKGLIEG